MPGPVLKNSANHAKRKGNNFRVRILMYCRYSVRTQGKKHAIFLSVFYASTLPRTSMATYDAKGAAGVATRVRPGGGDRSQTRGGDRSQTSRGWGRESDQGMVIGVRPGDGDRSQTRGWRQESSQGVATGVRPGGGDRSQTRGWRQ